uniref:Uncharacterized protein n=1 Tax=Spongospora subterranea TaxID=70186 RepID=A0A0H5RBA8_9EUKA|eukprot:CRZ11303.1 hypothetical protein [Spongospora subterranea]
MPICKLQGQLRDEFADGPMREKTEDLPLQVAKSLLHQMIELGSHAQLLLHELNLNRRKEHSSNSYSAQHPIRSCEYDEYVAADIDIFDDDSVWPKSQLKQYMFAGTISVEESQRIKEHLSSKDPLFDVEGDCGICLLGKHDAGESKLYKMACCGSEVHLTCIFRCLGARAIRNNCPICITDIPDDEKRDVILAMKTETRRTRTSKTKRSKVKN